MVVMSELFTKKYIVGGVLGDGRHSKGKSPLSQFAEPGNPPPPANDEVALAGSDGQKAARLLAQAQYRGSLILQSLSRRAVKRLAALPPAQRSTVKHLFDADELTVLADSLAATTATANLLGRARVRERVEQTTRAYSEEYRQWAGFVSLAENFAAEDWSGPQKGKRGGTFWINNRTGEKSYDDPAEADAGEVQAKSQVPVNTQGKLAKLRSKAAGVPRKVKDKASNFVARTYARLESKYGNTGAKFIMAGMVALLPVPLPGTSVIPIAIAEGIRRLGKLFGFGKSTSKNAETATLDAETLAAAMTAAIAEAYENLGQRPPVINHTHAVALARRLLAAPPVEASAAPSQFTEADAFEMFADAAPPTVLPPAAAVDYFTRLVPTLGVDPKRFAPEMRRTAFTLAAATDEALLGKVQNVIGEALKTGRTTNAVADIQGFLEAAGVAPKNPQYAELVYRTNMQSSYTEGTYQEMRSPDMQEFFPVYVYHAIKDGRARAHHAARDEKYYPAEVPFVEVRGTGIADAANCRCSFSPIDKFTWQELQSKGKRVEMTW